MEEYFLRAETRACPELTSVSFDIGTSYMRCPTRSDGRLRLHRCDAQTPKDKRKSGNTGRSGRVRDDLDHHLLQGRAMRRTRRVGHGRVAGIPDSAENECELNRQPGIDQQPKRDR